MLGGFCQPVIIESGSDFWRDCSLDVVLQFYNFMVLGDLSR